jgi:cell division protease FtsH
LKPFYKNLGLLLLVFLIFIMLFYLVNYSNIQVEQMDFSKFKREVAEGKIASVSIKGRQFTGTHVEGNKAFETVGYESDDVYKLLDEHKVQYKIEPETVSPFWSFMATWLPMILFIGIFIFFMRQLQSGGGKAMSFGKSKARLLSNQQKKVTFADVAGIEEAKEELHEIVEFLKDPKKFTKLGGKIPKGVLLMGPPGTGKTLLARAIAGEAGVPFFSISGSDFVEMFVGVGASRVRDLFVQGKKNAPCIIFIDEIDAVGRHRGAGLGGGHDEREQTLNQLLVEMDGFETNEGVILISATNRPDVLDPALLRPGRFDRRVIVGVPDIKGREGILAVHARGIPLSSDVDLSVLARGTPGFTGADLANLVNEAALLAARQGKTKVRMVHFEDAKDKVLMGTERRSMIISDLEKKNTAYHEAGHALVAMSLPGTDPIHKVSIIPRGMALGLTQQLPIDEKHTYPKDFLVHNIAILMGGRAAEETFLAHLTTGAGNDIERATELARRMVCEWGMSDKLGPLTFGKKEELVFLGKEISQQQNYSNRTAEEIDDEIRSIVTAGYEHAKRLVGENRDAMERLAAALLDRETLSGEEIRQVMAGQELAPRIRAEDEEPDEEVPQATLVEEGPSDGPDGYPAAVEGAEGPADRRAGASADED